MLTESLALFGAAVIAYAQEIEKNKRMTAEQKTAARVALSKAFHSTEGYYAGLRAGGKKDPTVEHEIAWLWDSAGTLMLPFNKALAGRLSIKSRFWREGALWSDKQIKESKIQLDAVRRDGAFALAVEKKS